MFSAAQWGSTPVYLPKDLPLIPRIEQWHRCSTRSVVTKLSELQKSCKKITEKLNLCKEIELSPREITILSWFPAKKDNNGHILAPALTITFNTLTLSWPKLDFAP